jgi:hypothetical protein
MLLTFLIPAYCRRQGALQAALSILDQCNSTTKGLVDVWINDDCSPQFDLDQYNEKLWRYQDVCEVRLSRNPQNLGMSKNIFQMVNAVKSEYWTVLTDDDFLLPGALLPLIDLLRGAAQLNAHSVATLRYCFDESGNFLFRDVVRGTHYPSLIQPGPVVSMKHIQNAHVLTGLIIKSGLDLSLWNQNIDNAYFPMINFSSTLRSGLCLTIDRPWFRHTVNNQTFWHQWGDSELAIHRRINLDYLVALSVSRNQALACSRTIIERLAVSRYYCQLTTSTLATFLSNNTISYVLSLVMRIPGISFLDQLLLFLCLIVAPLNTALNRLLQLAKRPLLKFYRPSRL